MIEFWKLRKKWDFGLILLRLLYRTHSYLTLVVLESSSSIIEYLKYNVYAVVEGRDTFVVTPSTLGPKVE